MLELLGGEDASWLRMEDATNPMVINSLAFFGGKLDVARVRNLIETRSLPPRFRARIVEPALGFGVPRIETDPWFRVDHHVVHVELEAGDVALSTFLGTTISGLLDRAQPLWRVYVIDRPDSGTVLLFRVHHCLADGFALVDQFFSLCDERESDQPFSAIQAPPKNGFLRQGLSLSRLVALRPDPHTSLKNPLGCEKRVAWSKSIPLDRIKTMGRHVSATVNDVLVSAVAGSIRQHLGTRGERVSDVRAMVPVNLRPHGATDGLGNRFGLVVLSLPVGIANAQERLLEVKRRMDQLKGTPEAIVAEGLLRAMGHMPRKLEDAGVAFFGKKASLVLTNVPGPRAVLHLDGVPIERVVFWVPQAARMGLGVSIFSYAGQVTIGVLADTHIVEHPASLIDTLEDELDSLYRMFPVIGANPAQPPPGVTCH